MSRALKDLLETSFASPNVSNDDKSRLRPVMECKTTDAWWDFVCSVSDFDAPVLQQVRTLIMSEVGLAPGKVGHLFAVNAMDRRNPDILFNPNQDEETGKATETTAFLEKDASLSPENLRRTLEANRDRCRYIKIIVPGESETYISLRSFFVKSILMKEPVPSVSFGGIHIFIH